MRNISTGNGIEDLQDYINSGSYYMVDENPSTITCCKQVDKNGKIIPKVTVQMDVCDESQKIVRGSIDFSPSSLSSLVSDWVDTAPKFRMCPDLPENRAFLDMGISDQTLQGALNEEIRADVKYNDLTIKGGQVVRVRDKAGSLNRACFSELCVTSGNKLLRIEPLTGRECPKQEKIEWIATELSCSLEIAARFRDCFKILELGSNEFYKLLKKVKSSRSIDKSLTYLEILSGKVYGFKLESENFESSDSFDDEGNLITFDDEGGGAEWTAKRLSSPDENLSDAEIDRLKGLDYSEYCKANSEYRSNKFGMPKSNLTSSALSMAWLILNRKKQIFDAEKATAIKATKKALRPALYDAISDHKMSPSKSTRYRLTVLIHGGVWNGEQVQKASKNEAALLWAVWSGKE